LLFVFPPAGPNSGFFAAPLTAGGNTDAGIFLGAVGGKFQVVYT
jgi:hypothetical protein